jgi:hypothetical protein
MLRPVLVLLVLMAPAAAQTAAQRDVQEFLASCQAAAARDADGRRSEYLQAAICLSYIQGFKDGVADAADKPKFCIPPKILFGDQVAAFVRWAEPRKDSLAGPKQAELLRFFRETYPCQQ